MEIDSSAHATPPALPESDRTVWNKVIGIICIVFGGGGALMAVAGLVSNKTMAKFSAEHMKMSGVDPVAYEELVAEWSGITLAIGIVTCVVAFVLLAGGILLLMRKRPSGTTLKSWAWLKILLLCIILPIQATSQKEFLDLMMKGSLAGEGAELAAAGMRIGMVVGLAFWAVFGLLLPVFILIWFSRRKIKEQVAFWR